MNGCALSCHDCYVVVRRVVLVIETEMILIKSVIRKIFFQCVFLKGDLSESLPCFFEAT